MANKSSRRIKKDSTDPQDVMARLRDALKKLIGRVAWTISRHQTHPFGSVPYYEIAELTAGEAAALERIGMTIGPDHKSVVIPEPILFARWLPFLEAEGRK